ncbi:hypothetical protein GF327_05450 [Candidatus Woesearchaeota archaeon]|nr:hypothetical protein [Candidatus Woesearchaeota archaeon]
MINIYLTGPFGAGKSSTAIELGKILDKEVIDLDEVFHSKYGSIGDYIAKKGWRKMIHASSRILRSLPTQNFIIPQPLFSTQDVHDIKESDAKFCKKNGILVLILPAKSIQECALICFERENRRNYEIKYEEVLKRLKYSIPFYKKYANIIIYDNSSPRSAAEKIKIKLKKLKLI